MLGYVNRRALCVYSDLRVRSYVTAAACDGRTHERAELAEL
jgi:hypothetical protein